MANEIPPGQGHQAGSPDRWCDRFELIPIAVAIPILGMLGGMCGEPVSVWLQDYPSDVLGALQRFLRAHVPAELVYEVFGSSDIRRLIGSEEVFAMLLIYPTPGHSTAGLVAQWLLERGRQTRLPMALLCGEQCDQEAPGAILSLRAGPSDTTRLRILLAGHPLPDGRVKDFLSRSPESRIEVSFAGLPALFGPGPISLWTPRSLRALQTLRGLLAGHSLLRRLVDSPEDLGLVSPDLVDYAGVYEILQRSRAGLPEESGDPILAAMIRRANLYIKGREVAAGVPSPVPAGREGFSSLATARNGDRGPSRNRPISLRELADLGNVRSSMTSSLVDAALASHDLKTIHGLGLRRRLPTDTSPGSLGKDEIVSLLVIWSMKQVRKRFDRLRRQGFIEGERDPAGNGPWIIHLPEELKPLPGEFQNLPTVDRVSEVCRQQDERISPA